MKLAITGGGGVRAPLLVSAALRCAGDINLEELSLLDIDARRLELIDGLCKELARQMSSPVRVFLQGKKVGADLCVRPEPVCPPLTYVSAPDLCVRPEPVCPPWTYVSAPDLCVRLGPMCPPSVLVANLVFHRGARGDPRDVQITLRSRRTLPACQLNTTTQQ